MCVFQEKFNIIAEPRSAFVIQGFMSHSHLQSIISFLMWILFPFSFSFFFFHIWDLGYNSLEFILAMLRLLFQVSTKVSSKVNAEFISWNALCWWSVHVPPFHQTIMNRLWLSGYLAPMLKSLELSSDYSYCISWLHRPMVLCFVSTNFTNNL